MNGQDLTGADRYWVIGGRWVEGAKHVVWPRVFGPYPDYSAARASAANLNDPSDPSVRYLVVADVAEGAA